MAIRIRTVDGVLVALCAAETDPVPGDVYLNDNEHYALAAKFARDWRGQVVTWIYEEEDRLADTQKLRDAKEEHEKWAQENQTTDISTPNGSTAEI